MKLLNIDHIHFFATDLDEAIRFYEDVGFRLVQRFEHGGREGMVEKAVLTREIYRRCLPLVGVRPPGPGDA